ncbi:MAG TPA: CPBP family glutamic-type intramembrane protease [Rhizomicrobium sp.]|jgi:hypothetical protein|nr:CPBP family glutamic-type intramembrane protease [Rhizomicrobium sp.]
MPDLHFAVAAGLGAVLAFSAANFAANHLAPRHPRLVYVLFVVLLAGTVIPALALRTLARAAVAGSGALAFSPWPLGLALAAGGAFLALSLRGEHAEQIGRLPGLLVALLPPSLAEVLVFVGIVFNLAEHLTAPWLGRPLAIAAAILTTSVSFGLYHLTHAAPWNSRRMVRILLIVWLFIGGFYAATGNLWATALLNTAMAAVGFVKNRVTRPTELSFAALLALDAAAVGIVLASL